MATKMRTGRMTVKTTTKGPGDPTKPKNLKQVTVTGDRGYNDQEKEFLKLGNRSYEYYPGLGKKAGGVKLTPSELEEFNKNYESQGGKLKYKEVRYDPKDPINKGGVKRFQGDYAHPTKEKQYYKSQPKINPATPQKAPEKIPVGSLPTRKLTTSTPTRTLATAPKKKEMVSKAIEAPAGKGRKMKNTPRVGGSIQKNKLTKTDLNIKGQIAGAKFRREEKLAGAYTRTKSLADENQGPNVRAGAFSKEKKAGYQALRSDLKAARKETGVKVGSALRDARKSQKFEKKEQVGKTKYFTKAKMSEQVEKKPGMKGRMQAGKMRYK